MYNAKNIGICINIGRQPDRGLTFSDLYKAIISCCIFNLSVLYLSLISVILGVSIFILLIDLKDLLARGNNRILIKTVRAKIDRPTLPNKSDSLCNNKNKGFVIT